MKYIKLSQGNIAIISDEDFESLSKYKWHFSKAYGAGRSVSKYGVHWTVTMNRQITNCPNGSYVDHINRNRLDNRRENLRICTNAENNQNRPKSNHKVKPTSKYKGVYYDKLRDSYRAYIWKDSKYYFIGRFKKELEAAEARDIWAGQLHGAYACFNL
jgi:hypothetical protein